MRPGPTKFCTGCGRMITFVKTPNGGSVACDAFSVKVRQSKIRTARLFYLGNGKTVWGERVELGNSDAVTAWEPHDGRCSNPRLRQRGRSKLSPDELAEARQFAAEEKDRTVQVLLARREKEWEAAGHKEVKP